MAESQVKQVNQYRNGSKEGSKGGNGNSNKGNSNKDGNKHGNGGQVGVALTQLDRTMRYARAKLGADITIQRLLILINVYLHEGLSQTELLAQLDGTSVTALSRNLADLSAWTTKKQPGPCLIELQADPMNLRRKTIHLTPKGRRLIRQLAQAPGIGGAKAG